MGTMWDLVMGWVGWTGFGKGLEVGKSVNKKGHHVLCGSFLQDCSIHFARKEVTDGQR